MKKLYISVIFSLFTLGLVAQQDPQFSQYMFNNMLINPGYAGINKSICLSTVMRQQWVGFKSTYTLPDGSSGTVKTNPQTYGVAVDMPVRFLRGGLGLSFISDKLGFENNIGVNLAYSFHINNVGPGVLGIGVQGGFLNKKIDFSKFNPIDPSDPLIALSSEKQTTMMFTLAAGLFYNIPNKAYVGISTTQLLGSKMKFQNSAISESQLKRHYYITGSYSIDVAPDWEVIPYVMVKTDFTSAQYDITAMARWQKRVWGGITYRVQDAVSIILGAYPFRGTMSGLRIGYSYDVTTMALGKNSRSSGSHEVTLGYCFKIVSPPKFTRYLNVRY